MPVLELDRLTFKDIQLAEHLEKLIEHIQCSEGHSTLTAGPVEEGGENCGN